MDGLSTAGVIRAGDCDVQDRGTLCKAGYENKDGRMETEQMGNVIVTAKIESLEDLFDVEKGSISSDVGEIGDV